eukprot:Skav214611  [mRNA]  locus=scaffold57:1024017:1025300:- [translate_table: standard]
MLARKTLTVQQEIIDPHEAEDPVICQAAKYGDIAAVRHFLRTDPDAVHRADRNGAAAQFVMALGRRQGEEQLMAVDFACDWNQEAMHSPDAVVMFAGFTALRCAAGHGHVEVVSVLVAAGARIEATIKGLACRGETPLYLAAGKGQAAVVAQLLKLRASVAPRDERCSGPWGCAAKTSVEARHS